MARQDYLCIGTAVKPQGVKGELKIKPATDDVRRFAYVKRVYIARDGVFDEVRVLKGREAGGFGYLLLEGLDTPEAAEAWRGVDLYVARKDALPLSEGSYYIVDLLGCTVRTDTGLTLGELKDIAQHGGNDVYTVKGERGCLFPAVKDLFERIDVDQGLIVVREKRLEEVAVFDD